MQARLANQLSDRFFDEFRYRPAPSEVTSWRNSLRRHGERAPARRPDRPGDPRRAQAAAVVEAPRRADHRLEPDDRRLRGDRRAQAVDRGRPLEHHRLRHRRLRRPPARRSSTRRARSRSTSATCIDTHPAFSDGAIDLDACAYLHNAQHDPKSPLYHADFATLLATNPSFAGDQRRRLRELPRRTASSAPTTAPILDRVASTAFKPAQAPARPRRPGHPQRARVHRSSTSSSSPTTRSSIRSAAPARTSSRSSSSSRAGPAPASRSSRSTSSPSSPSSASGPST